jgi:hypothetical protein
VSAQTVVPTTEPTRLDLVFNSIVITREYGSDTHPDRTRQLTFIQPARAPRIPTSGAASTVVPAIIADEVERIAILRVDRTAAGRTFWK